jgi:N-carbamoyl-L-amino-acid hydrolase
MLASGVFAGEFTLDYALSRTDAEGRRFGEELDRIGYAGPEPCGAHPLAAYFEAHIEQGPILEQTHTTIGVVTGVQGLRWYDVMVVGQDAHAGSTPMETRSDALRGAASLVETVNQIALTHAPHGRGTVGFIQVSPNSRNTIPGHVKFSVDLRHPDPAALAAMDADLIAAGQRLTSATGLQVTVEAVSYSPPVQFNPVCVTAVETAAAAFGYTYRRMISGAGHDACYINQVAPTAMIFVPCADGISHSEAESAQPNDLTAGANVLLHAVLQLAA